MDKLALFAATPGMVAGCCYVMDVTVDSTGIVLERTDARPLGAPGSICPGGRPAGQQLPAGSTLPARRGARAHGACATAGAQ